MQTNQLTDSVNLCFVSCDSPADALRFATLFATLHEQDRQIKCLLSLVRDLSKDDEFSKINFKEA